MRNRASVKLILCALLFGSASSVGAREEIEQASKMCQSLRLFVSSVHPGDSRSLEFHTSWGVGFRDSPEKSIYAKRCTYNQYAPAEAVCEYLMKYGQVEFSGINAKEAIHCLSPGSYFSNRLQLDRVDTEFAYGGDNHGANVIVRYEEDSKVGGMVLLISVDGY